jgi:hypothetical protein
VTLINNPSKSALPPCILCEPYFDTDFTRVLYLTDTGRRWDGDHVSIRDKTTRRGVLNTPPTQTPPLHTRAYAIGAYAIRPYTRHKKTNHIINAAHENHLPDQVMLTIHPQRWTDKLLPWMQELVWQNV